MKRLPEWKAQGVGDKFVFGFAHREGIERFGLLDNFAVRFFSLYYWHLSSETLRVQ